MDSLNKYSYIWGADKDKYVLLNDELGSSILFLKDKEVMFLVIEEDFLVDLIIDKMIESGNKVYNSITEFQEEITMK